jgi:hypothetical protein
VKGVKAIHIEILRYHIQFLVKVGVFFIQARSCLIKPFSAAYTWKVGSDGNTASL